MCNKFTSLNWVQYLNTRGSKDVRREGTVLTRKTNERGKTVKLQGLRAWGTVRRTRKVEPHLQRARVRSKLLAQLSQMAAVFSCQSMFLKDTFWLRLSETSTKALSGSLWPSDSVHWKPPPGSRWPWRTCVWSVDLLSWSASLWEREKSHEWATELQQALTSFCWSLLWLVNIWLRRKCTIPVRTPTDLTDYHPDLIYFILTF